MIIAAGRKDNMTGLIGLVTLIIVSLAVVVTIRTRDTDKAVIRLLKCLLIVVCAIFALVFIVLLLRSIM